jgi:DNA-binding transcriptional ArsR family regulator
MKSTDAVARLAALAQETRLALFRRLVQTGPQGLTPGELAAEFGLPPATLSFHLKELSQAGLLGARQEGRFIHYSVSFAVMDELIGYLTENCCGGQPCLPATAKRRRS